MNFSAASTAASAAVASVFSSFTGSPNRNTCRFLTRLLKKAESNEVLCPTDVEPDDLGSIQVVQKLFPEIKWTFLVGEGNPKTKARMLAEHGIVGDVIFGVSSWKKHPETKHKDGKTPGPDDWEKEKLDAWLAANPTSLILCIKPPREFLTYDSSTFAGRIIAFYGSFNFLCLINSRNAERNAANKEGLIRMITSAEESYVFETYYAFGQDGKNTIDGSDDFPWENLGPAFTRSLYAWNRSQADSWLNGLLEWYDIKVTPTWNDGETVSSNTTVDVPSSVTSYNFITDDDGAQVPNGKVAATADASWTKYDLEELVSRGYDNVKEIFSAIYDEKELFSIWKSLRGLVSILSGVDKQFVNADTGLASALLMDDEESASYLSRVDPDFLDDGRTKITPNDASNIYFWNPPSPEAQGVFREACVGAFKAALE